MKLTPEENRITIVIGSKHDGWISSELYFQRLLRALSSLKNSSIEISHWHSQQGGNEIFRRRILYPLELASQVRGPLHLLDQSYADSLLRFSGKSILTINDTSFWRYRGKNPLRKLVRRRILRGIQRATWLISISQLSCNEIQNLLDYPLQNISIVPFAIDTAFFSSAPALPEQIQKIIQADPFILHVGSLTPRKGMGRFLDAYAMDKNFPKFVQVGGAPDTNLLDKIYSLRLSKKIFFLGRQPQEVLHSLYALCAAFVFPSEYEGFGIPPLEARAAGAKILTTPMPSICESLYESAGLSPQGSSREWRDALRDILHQPAPAPLSAKAKYELSWERLAKETMKVYQKVLNGDV